MENTKRVALVTGGTGGIGKATARRLVEDGYTVVIVGRSPERGQQAAAEIGVTYMQADLSLMAEVKRLADAFRQTHNRLDILIHSAGVIHTKRMLTEEGLEATFATDYLSRFYLTNLLMDLLDAAGSARIINIGAAGGGRGSIDFDDLLGAREIGGMRALGQAQFANDVHTVELARRLQGTDITVNVMHPGMVDTDIRREWPTWIDTVMGFVFSPMVMSADEGGEAPYYLATSPKVAGISGGLFRVKKQLEPSDKTTDPALGQRLWEVSERLIDEVMGVPA